MAGWSTSVSPSFTTSTNTTRTRSTTMTTLSNTSTNSTSSSHSGSNSGSNGDSSSYQQTYDPYGITSGYSTVYVAVSIMVCLGLILLTVCTLVKRRRSAAGLLQGSGLEAQQSENAINGRTDWNNSESEQAEMDAAAFAAPSYATVMAGCGRVQFANAADRGLINQHLHRHYAVGDEPSSVTKQYADFPPNYDDIAILTTPVRSVSQAPSEPGSCASSGPPESADQLNPSASPERTGPNGFSNLAFHNDEPESNRIPAMSPDDATAVAGQLAVAVGPNGATADSESEIPPPAYNRIVGSLQ